MIGNDLPNGVMSPNEGFCGTVARNGGHRENPDEVGSMTECHPDRVGGARLTCRRGFDKDSYAPERH